DKAIENYNMSIVLNPKFAEAYFNRGLCYYNKKDFDKATEDYNKSADIDPKNAVIYNNRGDAFYRKQDFDKAIVDYDKAISINPRYLKAYYNRGLAYACQQDYERAIEDFNKVVELNPDFAEAYHIRGLAYDYMGNFDRAIADYDKAVELNPNFTEAINHRELAKSKKERGDFSPGGDSGAVPTEPGQGPSLNPIKLLQKPNMNFKDVAGLDRLKEIIKDSIVYPLMDPDLARKYGKLGGGGILFYGPPGCGKTFIVKGAAGECKSAFINAKISDILDMYVGNTEKNLHNIFETARKNSPCLVFIDEVEALGGRRDQMQQQPYQKMAVNQLLYEMDGIEAKNENVLVIGATNAPWDVDPALRRSGRFTKHVYVPEPDKKSREQLFKLYLAKLPTSKGIGYGRLARATVGYAASDVKTICEDAAAIPWKEAFVSQQEGKKAKQREVTMRDLIAAVKRKKSSLPPWYESAKKEIGQQEEKTVVDGKEHIKITESKMAAGEKEQFKELLDVIKKNNEWWYKGYKWFLKHLALYVF
ncbi:AAA family ATPase, partial [Candidatus Micrarchaeota archaeon]|nr:AAA family ATPase [Candidatus Micrarchaeota archaeon]